MSDLSDIWLICDVFENDLDAVQPGKFADIRLNAYPTVKGAHCCGRLRFFAPPTVAALWLKTVAFCSK
jgi:multidrug resistance efflux pump